jgi:hypothetical protein
MRQRQRARHAPERRQTTGQTSIYRCAVPATELPRAEWNETDCAQRSPQGAAGGRHQWARETVRHSLWAAAYCEQQRAKGCRLHTAVRALAYKWQRIIWRCWQNRTPYSEEIYLTALSRSRSPLANKLTPQPNSNGQSLTKKTSCRITSEVNSATDLGEDKRESREDRRRPERFAAVLSLGHISGSLAEYSLCLGVSKQ